MKDHEHVTTREMLAAAWSDVIENAPSGGTWRERQAYGNGARDALDSLADILGLPLGTDPWDKWTAKGDDEA